MAGYSGTPLLKKLGIKPGIRLYVSGAPEAYFSWLSPLPDNVDVTTRLSDGLDFIHLFVKTQKDFKAQFVRGASRLRKDGMLWVSWPKRASKVPTDLDENIIREFGLQNGLVDVKICAVDEVWSALKFVFRLTDRK